MMMNRLTLTTFLFDVMKYNLAKDYDMNQALEYLTRLVGQEAVVEIKKINPKRTLHQGAYLHVLINIFSLGTGYSAQESKQIMKQYAVPDVFVYKKKGMQFVRSTADLTTEEMGKVIDKYREFGAGHGITMPAPEDKEALLFWQNQIERESRYL
jgi:hypothetical protein